MKNAKAYGCYGYVATFSDESSTCKACPLYKPCRGEAYTALKAMSSEVDVTSLLGRFGDLVARDNEPIRIGHKTPKNRRQKLKQYAQSGAEALLVMSLPVKQRRLVTGLHQKGIPVRNLILGGANPFDKHRPAFMRVPCRMVIEQGKFTRAQLKSALMAEFPNWGESTAESQASIAVGVLTALKVVKKINDTYHKLD